MIVLWKNGLEIRLNDENGQKLKVNLQKSKNDGKGQPVVWIGDLTDGGKKWYSLSKLKEGINEITDLEKAERSSSATVKSTKLEEYLTKEEYEEYSKALEIVNNLKEIANKRKDEETLVDRYLSGKIKIDDLNDEQIKLIRNKMQEVLNRLEN